MTDPAPAVDQLNIPVSPGELLDKLSILALKSERIQATDQLARVRDEWQLLNAVWQATGVHHSPQGAEIEQLRVQLQDVNGQLWEVEDRLRELEAGQDFGAEFVRLARSVYQTNDRRAAIKREINELLGSRLREEKSYSDYQGGNT